jgi:hypothetical protein
MISNSGTFSANVRLNLYVNGQQYDVGSLGPGFGYLRNAHDISETEGELETRVDEKTTRWPVRITSPITTASKRFTFEAV